MAVCPGPGEVVQVNDLNGPNPAQTRIKARLQKKRRPLIYARETNCYG